MAQPALPPTPPPTPTPSAAAASKRLIKAAYLQVVTEPVWAQIPERKPNKFIPPIISTGQLRRWYLARSVNVLSLANSTLRVKDSVRETSDEIKR